MSTRYDDSGAGAPATKRVQADLDRLAQRVAALVVAALTSDEGGPVASHIYDRDPEPDTGGGLRGNGARYGAVTAAGLVLDGGPA